jgi:hypothetical protein
LSPANFDAAAAARENLSGLAPQITLTPNSARQLSPRLQIVCVPNQKYLTQVSRDLIQWTTISTDTPAASPYEVVDNATRAAGEYYYRVLWVKP